MARLAATRVKECILVSDVRLERREMIQRSWARRNLRVERENENESSFQSRGEPRATTSLGEE